MKLPYKPYYFEAEDGLGDVCGHKHRYFDQAVGCARSLERLARRRGFKRQEWRVQQVMK